MNKMVDEASRPFPIQDISLISWKQWHLLINMTLDSHQKKEISLTKKDTAV